MLLESTPLGGSQLTHCSVAAESVLRSDSKKAAVFGANKTTGCSVVVKKLSLSGSKKT